MSDVIIIYDKRNMIKELLLQSTIKDKKLVVEE